MDRVSPRYCRPSEVETLLGGPIKAKELLGWVPKFTVEEMSAETVANDLNQAKLKALLKEHGYLVPVARGSQGALRDCKNGESIFCCNDEIY